jgi:hypothetical protein
MIYIGFRSKPNAVLSEIHIAATGMSICRQREFYLFPFHFAVRSLFTVVNHVFPCETNFLNYNRPITKRHRDSLTK